VYAGGGESIALDKFKTDFEALSVKAIASVFVNAYTNGANCAAVAGASTSVCQCLNKYESCVQDGQVLGCCDEGFSCIKAQGSRDELAKCRSDAVLTNTRNVALTETCGAK
jgi:hypothetical protein